jgi:hypothetical protein
MPETIRTQENCYLSTPERVRSFVGRFLLIYTAKGSLRLTSYALLFTSRKKSLEIPLQSITDISTGHYSRIAKPRRLDYISVQYNHEAREETILLTPMQSWSTRVAKTNALVASWISSLKEAVHR